MLRQLRARQAVAVQAVGVDFEHCGHERALRAKEVEQLLRLLRPRAHVREHALSVDAEDRGHEREVAFAEAFAVLVPA